MSVKLLTEHHLEFLSLNEAAQARLRLHLSNCHIVGNIMHWLNWYSIQIKFPKFEQNQSEILTIHVEVHGQRIKTELF